MKHVAIYEDIVTHWQQPDINKDDFCENIFVAQYGHAQNRDFDGLYSILLRLSKSVFTIDRSIRGAIKLPPVLFALVLVHVKVALPHCCKYWMLSSARMTQTGSG